MDGTTGSGSAPQGGDAEGADGRLGRLIERSVDGVLVLARDGSIRYANASARALLGRDDDTLVGQIFGLPLTPGESAELDIPRDGVVKVAELRASGAEWAGESAVLATLRDITQQKRAMEAQRFLAEAGSALAHSLDQPAILATVAELATPRLAEACFIDLVSGPRSFRRAVARRVGDNQGDFARLLVSAEPFDAEPASPALEVLATGRPLLLNRAAEATLCSMARDLDQVAALRGLGVRWALLVPLLARDRLLGILTLVGTGSTPRLDPETTGLAEELAHRSALALDNAALYEEATEAVRRRDEFLAVLAHELRNPLAPILYSAEALRSRTRAQHEVQRQLEVIDRQGRQLARLLDDLLDVARVTRGAIRLERAPVDLNGITRQAVQSCSSLLEARRHRIDLVLPDYPLFVDGDATRLEQILVNLLNNAAHYTPEGGAIQVEAFRAGREAEVRVRDNGRGMTPRELALVFELFVKGEWSPSRSHGGLGLGLTLVKRLVEMHGGRVSARSPGPGLGSEFIARLPALDEADRPLPVSTPAPGARAAVALRILLVEDLPDNREMLRDLLEMWGHEVLLAADGAEGLESVRSWRPDVALVDLGLPHVSGLELAERVSADPELASTFLVALTGYGQPEDRRQAREAGFSAHLVKPVNLEELMRVLARAGGGAGHGSR